MASRTGPPSSTDATGSTGAPVGPGGRSREHWLALLVALSAALGVAGVTLLTTPAPSGHGTHEQLGLPPCASMYLVGVPCPGCGVTTAVVLAARGRFADSLAAQPFGFALFLAVAAAAAWALLATAMRRDLAADAGRLNRRAVWLPVAALLVAAWIYKLVAVLG